MNAKRYYLPFNMSNIELLAQRCDELENHNNALRTKNNKLQNRLTQERRHFTNMAYTLKYEMDALKNMIMELEGQVSSILRSQRISTTHIEYSNPEIDLYCADDIADISHDEAQYSQSDFELSGSLSDSYCELEQHIHHDEDGFLKKMNQSNQQLPQQHQTSQAFSSPIKKMMGQVFSLKNRVKKKSFHINEAVNNGYAHSSLCRSSSCRDGTDTTEATAEASLSISRIPLLTPSNSHCLVSFMRWKRADFHSGGFYSGQIDVSTKLPDGFGVFHCFCNDDNCYLKGEWRFGELVQHLDYESDVDDDCDDDKVKKISSSDHLSIRGNGNNFGNCRDGDFFIRDSGSTFHNRFLGVDSIRGFRDPDSISVTEL